jgi:cell wall-associated NlpC family hydrolase
VPGLFATVALPAYAVPPVQDTSAVDASVALEEYKESNAQTVVVDAGASIAGVARDGFAAATQAELAASRQSAAIAAAAATASSGATTALDPAAVAVAPGSALDLSQIVAVGQQYIGTPYVFGGASPAGFDCSGFIKYVYGQFGVSLPHSVTGQAAAGTRIATADAVPGDLVIMSGHDGIYMGNGMIMDAPKPGGAVSIRPIWTSSYYIVRIGA